MILGSDDNSDESEDEATEAPFCRTITKSIRAHSICHMMVYAVTDGKSKTPLHVTPDQSVYFRCRSAALLHHWAK